MDAMNTLIASLAINGYPDAHINELASSPHRTKTPANLLHVDRTNVIVMDSKA